MKLINFFIGILCYLINNINFYIKKDSSKEESFVIIYLIFFTGLGVFFINLVMFSNSSRNLSISLISNSVLLLGVRSSWGVLT